MVFDVDQLVQRQIRRRSPEPTVLGLQFLQALDLITLQPTIRRLTGSNNNSCLHLCSPSKGTRPTCGSLTAFTVSPAQCANSAMRLS